MTPREMTARDDGSMWMARIGVVVLILLVGLCLYCCPPDVTQ